MQNLRLPHDHGDSRNLSAITETLDRYAPFSSAADLFKQLSDPTRIRLFWLLCHREECVCNLSALLKTSSPALSHHLRVLKQCGLVDRRRRGKEVYYKAADTVLCRLLHPTIEQVMELACPQGDPEASNTEIIHRVHDYLIDHIGERITIEQLSRLFLINPTTLKTVFKTEYGMSVAAHIKQHRMTAAAEMLTRTDRSISEIAESVGYESQSRFSAAFRERFGVLPTEYRNAK